MTEIKISIILPNYNSEKYLSRCIQSFLDQDYLQKELIIVDAKSTDSSHSIINQFCSENNSIKWIQERDINVTDGINIGLKYCTGTLIAFLASDVFYYSNDLFSTVAYHYKLVPFDGIYFDYYSYQPQNSKLTLWKCPLIEFNKHNLLSYGTIVGFDNIFIHKRVYEKYHYNPDFNLCSDWEFFLRITDSFKLFMYVEKVATINVQDGQNLSIKFQVEQMRQIREVGELNNTNHIKLYFDTKPDSVKVKAKKVLKKCLRRIGNLIS